MISSDIVVELTILMFFFVRLQILSVKVYEPGLSKKESPTQHLDEKRLIINNAV